MAILWGVKAIFEKRAAMVEAYRFILPKHKAEDNRREDGWED